MLSVFSTSVKNNNLIKIFASLKTHNLVLNLLGKDFVKIVNKSLRDAKHHVMNSMHLNFYFLFCS